MHPNLRPGEDFQHFLERQAAEMQQQAAALTDAFAEAGATVTSRDGSVTVTLAANGALRDLRLGNRACELGPARLTAAIMATVGQAQRQTARSVFSSLEAITGGGESVELVKSFLPPEPDDGDAAANTFAEAPELPDAPPPPPQAITPQAPTAPRRRPAPRDDEEDEANPW
ncbi:YbaB/EbfC family nucleoid-associated protein [Prauserella oleivorans]|uniref:YbaB/EbfC family nucleoid-associated protein n=1 Tax=Prauserella oleivorans TaxID=1478153 RepID=A0ABW5WG70_9PSEU